MTTHRVHAQRRRPSLDENLSDDERAALRSLLDTWAAQRRTANPAARSGTNRPLPLGAELAIAESIERHILEWAISTRHVAERIEQRARKRLAEIDEVMQQLNGVTQAIDDDRARLAWLCAMGDDSDTTLIDRDLDANCDPE
jgi:hypothetical protein